MTLSGTRLKGNLATDILTQIQTAFPIPSALLDAEKTKLQAAQSALATAIANGSGPDIITEITSNAVIPLGIAVATAGGPTAQTGATTASGTVT